MSLAFLSLAAAPLGAQQPSQPVVTSHIEKIEAIVEAIEASTRTVVLKSPHGVFSVVAGPAVHNFEKIHAGDKVKVSYYQGLAAQIKKGDKAVSEPVASNFMGQSQEGKPGGVMGRSVTTTVSIQAIDPAANTVAFKRSDGTEEVVAVEAPKMREFIRTLKPGDVVEVTYTESVAIDLTPAS